MITTIILTILFAPILVFLDLLPSLPNLPQEIIDGGDWVTAQFQTVHSVLNMLFGAPFVTAVIVVMIALINFQWIYNLVIWTLKKLPFVNVS